jgi:hypothetical protein
VEVVVATAAAIVAVAAAVQQHPVVKCGDNGSIGATHVDAICSMIVKIARILADARRVTRMKLLMLIPWVEISHGMGFGTGGASPVPTDHSTALNEEIGGRKINVVII